MYGLPGQSQEEAMADLDAVLAMGVPHISWYQLTLEPNTVFAKHPPAGMPQQDNSRHREPWAFTLTRGWFSTL